jgi:Protein of unknown function (DUF2786)
MNHMNNSNTSSTGSSSSSSLIEKIKRLLALAAGSTGHEAETAARLADKLIQENRIGEAELQQNSSAPKDPYIKGQPLFTVARITQWKVSLGQALATQYGCFCFLEISNATGHKVTPFALAGTAKDLEIVHFLYAYLTSEIERLCKAKYYGKGAVACNSYCIGAVAGIRDQFAQNRVQDQVQHSTALVALDSRVQEAKEAVLGSQALMANKSVSKSRISNEAYYSGKADGQRLHLGKGLGSGDSTKRLGA